MNTLTEQYQLWMASMAIFLALYAYGQYLKSMFQGKTKPHFCTWLVWFIVTAIAVFIQMLEGAGMGAWPTLVAAFICFFVTVLSIKYGSKDIRRIDFIFLIASLCIIPVWLLADNPALAALLVTVIEIIAALPTIRKSWHHPHEETMSTYGLNTIRYTLSIFALASFSIATVAYPLGMVVMNGSIFLVLLVRRTALTQAAKNKRINPYI